MSAQRRVKPGREQMPGLLARIDDPWGISWRVANRMRRVSARRALRFAKGLATGVRHESPVFVLGAPRSGTTMLFRVLQQSDELGSLRGEGHDLWRTYHHPRRSGWSSDAVGAEDVGFGERRFVDAWLYSHFDGTRFVEKTPENSLRVPYLLELFPDATFVVMKRNPCDVVSSLIDAWRHPAGRYRSYFVPVDLHIPGHDRRRQWCFALFEGWRDYTSATVPEIACAQWEHHIRALAESRSLVPPAQWIDIHLERLLEHPHELLSTLCDAIGIRETRALWTCLDELRLDPVNALSAPREEKWRAENEAEILALLPKIAESSRLSGYAVDPETGAFEITD